MRSVSIVVDFHIFPGNYSTLNSDSLVSIELLVTIMACRSNQVIVGNDLIFYFSGLKFCHPYLSI
jgi:hypothetical protein